MQKRKIEDDAIWDAYKRIVLGESLTVVASKINIDRGTLRKYIEIVVVPSLTENEKNTFYQCINQNFRGNSTENKRANRNGIRKSAEESIEESEEIKRLAEYGVTPAQIEDLYNRLRQDKKTSYSRDTYIYKCLEHIEVFSEFDFCAEEIFDIFIRRPKLFTSSANKIREMIYGQIRIYGSQEIVKQRFVEDPWLDFRTQESKDGGDR